MANQIPYLNDYQGDNYPVVYDEGEDQLKYVKNGNKSNTAGGVTIPATSYDNNADALAALGVGKLYRSSTLINGSPMILITV